MKYKNSQSQRSLLFYSCGVLGIAGIYLWMHAKASWYFPIPWPDEGTFLWQAIAFQKNNTLFAPQLHSENHIMWMPPGYMVWHGLLFKLTGFSLTWARWLAALYMVGGMMFFSAIVRQYRLPALALLGIGAVWLDRYFIFMGNMSRMEGPMIFMIGIGFWMLQQKHHYKALIFLSLTPLLHPNGLYYCLGAGIYFLVMIWHHPQYRRCTKGELALMSIPLVLWTAYFVYIGFQWDAFLEHMRFQFKVKADLRNVDGGQWHSWTLPKNWIPLILIVLLLIESIKYRRPIAFLGAIALPAKLLVITAPGATYQVYNGLSYALLWIMLYNILWERLNHHKVFQSRIMQAGFVGVVILSGWRGGFLLETVEKPQGYPYSMTVVDMKIPEVPEPYMTENEEQRIRQYLASLKSEKKPIFVYFYPHGDALFFHDLDGDHFRIFQPTFYEKIEEPAVHIIHESKYLSPLMLNIHGFQLYQVGYRGEWDKAPVLINRNETEKWKLYHVGKLEGSKH